MPDQFEVADVYVALGGDGGNTVPRYGVTAAEIAVLQAIHGDQAVHDIMPRGVINRSQRVERDRLKAVYAGARDGEGRAHVENIFPGSAARLFERLEELALADDQFAAVTRAVSGGSARQDAAVKAAQSAVDMVSQSHANRPLNPEDLAGPVPEREPSPIDEMDNNPEPDDLEDIAADDAPLDPPPAGALD